MQPQLVFVATLPRRLGFVIIQVSCNLYTTPQLHDSTDYSGYFMGHGSDEADE